ncbi:MAG: ribonuclease H-like domain-containing protein [Clostridiales bacterium]|nr:ribonuclease H-like domain-containing protein [Clostridiales bacterium]
MITHDLPITVPENILKQENISPESCLFFDIETTGLSWRRSHLYLLGAVFFDGCRWVHRQWFCQKPGEEKDVLLAFSHLLNEKKVLIHFNGNTFDVPYLMHKYTFYQLKQSWEHLTHLDLYKKLLPYKKLMGLEHMRQKDLEVYAGLHRKDPFTGAELIACYQEYLKSADERLLKALLLHNQEDVEGMIHLLPLLSIPGFFSGKLLEEVSASLSSDAAELVLDLSLKSPVSCLFSLENPFCRLEMPSEGRCRVHVTFFDGTLKHFFTDYKNYYYLPLEDEAIHKSVGEYVDKAHREKAKACNCYKKITGRFLPQPSSVFSPVFSMEYKDRLLWFSYADEFNADKEKLMLYAIHLLKSFQ